MEKIIKCKTCGKSFELTGGGSGREFTRIVGCFHCNEPVEFKWPMDGEYNASVIDGGTEPQSEL